MPSPAHLRIAVALVRHGDYEQPEDVPSAHLPHPLTAKGREQARELGARLHQAAADLDLEIAPVLHASALLRASQTASIAAAALGERMPDRSFTIAESWDLAERSTGAAANLTVQQIAAAVAADPRMPPLPKVWKTHPRFRLPFPGAESLMQAGARVAAHIENQVHVRTHALRGSLTNTPASAAPAQEQGTLEVFVSHGGALRHAAVCMGALELTAVPGLSMHHCGFVLLELQRSPQEWEDGAPGSWRQVGGQWKIRKPKHAHD
ncbi:MAG: histidine phosphatase family protein [Myxococcales bacterium]|nr:histidine phosphatase family protein [Myxococcales bacterium]